MVVKIILQIFFFAIVACDYSSVFATTSLVSDRTLFNSSDFVDWASFDADNPTIESQGKNLSIQASRTNSNEATSNNKLRSLEEGITWNGDFLLAENLLVWEDLSLGGLRLLFSTDVFGVGAQIGDNFYLPFNWEIITYDVTGAIISVVSVDGQSIITHDNSAKFVGIVSDIGNIRAIEFHSDNQGGVGQDWAINTLGIIPNHYPTSTTVPEPETISLFLLGCLLFFVSNLKKCLV
jgi:hypothetical protein